MYIVQVKIHINLYVFGGRGEKSKKGLPGYTNLFEASTYKFLIRIRMYHLCTKWYVLFHKQIYIFPCISLIEYIEESIYYIILIFCFRRVKILTKVY